MAGVLHHLDVVLDQLQLMFERAMLHFHLFNIIAFLEQGVHLVIASILHHEVWVVTRLIP